MKVVKGIAGRIKEDVEHGDRKVGIGRLEEEKKED
jgi:hypothetical protein